MSDFTELSSAKSWFPPQAEAAATQSNDPCIALDRMTEMQAQYTRIVDTLLVTSLGNVDSALEHALPHIAALSGADRVYVFVTHETQIHSVKNSEWHAEGVPSAIRSIEGLSPEFLAKCGWMDEFRAGSCVFIERVSDMAAGDPARGILMASGVRSFLAVPIQQEGHLLGYIGYDYLRDTHHFQPAELNLLRSLASIFYWVLMRHQSEASLRVAHANAVSSRDRLQSVLSAIPGMVVEVGSDSRLMACHSEPSLIPDGLFYPGDVMSALNAKEAYLTPALDDALGQLAADGRIAGKTVTIDHAGAQQRFQISGAAIDDASYALVLQPPSDQRDPASDPELLSDIVRHSTNMVLVTDQDRRIEWVNTAFEELTGWTLDKIRGCLPQEIMRNQRTDPEAARLIDEKLMQGLPVQAEILNVTCDEREVWLSLNIQPLRKADGSLRGFVAIGNDISNLRRHSEELKQIADAAAYARSTLEAAVEALHDGFVLYDPDDRLVICNKRYRELSCGTPELLQPGTKFEDILRHAVRQGAFPTTKGREEAWIEERMQQRQLHQAEFELQTADGSWIRVIDKATPDGGWVGLLVDITKLKLAEARAEAELAATLEASHDGITYFDPQGTITYINRSRLDLFGYADASEVLGRHWRVLYEPEIAEWVETHALKELRTTGHWSGEVFGLRRDGGRVHQDLSMTLKCDGGILCISRDASVRHREEAERNRLREELTISRRREVIGQLAAGLAHDFSNVLATISCGATLIEQNTKAGSLNRVTAARLATAALQANALIRRLLRLGAGSAEPMLMDLREPVREAAELIRAGMRNQADLRLDITDEPLNLLVDSTDVLQVVLNLTMNAIDALAGPTGEIVISLRAATAADLDGPVAVGHIHPRSRYYCLSVSDTGCGIAPDVADEAFKPYFSTKGSQGTGLGLAVIATIMRTNDGAIRLETSEGVGSTFTTLWSAEGSDLGPQLDGDLDGFLAGSRILLVDGQPDISGMLTRILESAGAEVATTDDPRLALDALTSDPGFWDAVIADFTSPGRSDIEPAKTIRKTWPQLPILLIAPRGGIAPPVGLFDAIIESPVKPSRLLRTIGQYIRKSTP